jgi:hypothetical protein
MEALSGIGQFFGSPAGKGIGELAGLGSAGAGLIGNLDAEKQRQQTLNTIKSNEALLANPQALASDVAQTTQPLNANLVQSVGNSVNANLAEQGLSQSPGITASVLTQSLAPYEQQNQQQALTILMQRLGLPIEYGKALLGGLPTSSNLAPLLALLQKSAGSGTGQPITNFPNIMQMFAQNQTPASLAQPTWSPTSSNLTPPDTGGY